MSKNKEQFRRDRSAFESILDKLQKNIEKKAKRLFDEYLKENQNRADCWHVTKIKVKTTHSEAINDKYGGWVALRLYISFYPSIASKPICKIDSNEKEKIRIFGLSDIETDEEKIKHCLNEIETEKIIADNLNKISEILEEGYRTSFENICHKLSDYSYGESILNLARLSVSDKNKAKYIEYTLSQLNEFASTQKSWDIAEHADHWQIKNCDILFDCDTYRKQGAYLITLNISTENTKKKSQTKTYRYSKTVKYISEADYDVDYSPEYFDKLIKTEIQEILYEARKDLVLEFSKIDDSLPKLLTDTLNLSKDKKSLIQGSIQGLKVNKYSYIAWGKSVELRGTHGKKSVASEYDLNWDAYEKAVEHPYSLDQKNPPSNIYEFTQFISAANRSYRSMRCIDGLPEKPIVKIQYDDAFLTRLMQAKGKNIRGKLHSILTDEMRKEYNRIHYDEYIKGVLNKAGLNKSELDVLKYIYSEGRGWFTDIRQHINSRYKLTYDALGRCLNKLSNVYILSLKGSNEVPLVSAVEMTRKYDETYTMYYPQDGVKAETLNEIKPRPYLLKEEEDITPKCRDEWRSEILETAIKEQPAWNALMIFESFPRPFQTKFIKTDLARDFFASFTGNDAEYAELLLRDISGGKALIKKIKEEKNKKN